MGVPIEQLSPIEIRNVVFEAVRDQEMFGADLIDRLLASIRWRGAHYARAETIDILMVLHGASHRYETGELSLNGYRDACISVFFTSRVARRSSVGRRSHVERH